MQSHEVAELTARYVGQEEEFSPDIMRMNNIECGIYSELAPISGYLFAYVYGDFRIQPSANEVIVCIGRLHNCRYYMAAPMKFIQQFNRKYLPPADIEIEERYCNVKRLFLNLNKFVHRYQL